VLAQFKAMKVPLTGFLLVRHLRTQSPSHILQQGALYQTLYDWLTNGSQQRKIVKVLHPLTCKVEDEDTVLVDAPGESYAFSVLIPLYSSRPRLLPCRHAYVEVAHRIPTNARH
jgi:hypothetical protein